MYGQNQFNSSQYNGLSALLGAVGQWATINVKRLKKLLIG